MIVRDEAELDLVEAIDWYESRRLGLGSRFEKAVERVFEQIERMPESHRVVYRDVRRARTQTFPFSVYYRMEGDEVIVLAVLHSRRDPNRWKSRL